MPENELDRKDLKIQALLEKISNLTTNYESMAADYRVELTVLNQELDRLRVENEFLESQIPKDAQGPEPTQDAD